MVRRERPSYGVPYLAVAFTATVTLAVLLRLFDLGRTVLSASEGTRSLAAWHLINGRAPDWWEAPGLVVGTAVSFVLLGDSDATARLFPSLAGSGTVVFLAVIRPWLGWWPALAAAVLVTLSPSGLALARSVAEDTPAALLTMAVGWSLVRFWDQQDRRGAMLTGAGAGALVHFGFPGITGAFALLLFALTLVALQSQPRLHPGKGWLKGFSLPFVSAFGLVGTGCLVYLDGFGVPSLTAWTARFGDLVPDQNSPPAGLVLAGYEAAALLLGVPAALLALRDWLREPGGTRPAMLAFLALWGLLALFFLLLGARANPSSVYASALPLSVLAGNLIGLGIARVDREAGRRLSWGLPVVASGAAFAWIALLRTMNQGDAASANRWLSAATVALPLGAILAVALGSRKTGPVLAVVAALMAVLIEIHGVAKLQASWPGQSTGHELAANAISEVSHLVPYTSLREGFSVQVQQGLEETVGWPLRRFRSASAPRVAAGSDLLVGDAAAGVAPISGYSSRTVPVQQVWSPGSWGWNEVVGWIATGAIPDGSRTTRRAVILTRVEGPA